MSITVKHQISAISAAMRDAYYNSFIMPDQFKPDLHIYKMLKWSASYFLNQWESNIGTYAAGTIRKYNHIFHVCFTAGLSIGWLKMRVAKDPDCQLVLSFRKHENLPGMVLVKLAFTKEI